MKPGNRYPEILKSFHLLEQWFSKIRKLLNGLEHLEHELDFNLSRKLKPLQFCDINIFKYQSMQLNSQSNIQSVTPPTWNISTFPTEPRKPPKIRASNGNHRFLVTIFTFPGSKNGDQTSVKETHRLCVHGLHYPAVFRLWWPVAYFMMSQEIRQTMGTP